MANERYPRGYRERVRVQPEVWENTVPAQGGGGGGSNNFLDLTDTPSAYTGQAGKVVAVKGAEDGLEFVPAGSVTAPLTLSSDTSPQLNLKTATGSGTSSALDFLNHTSGVLGRWRAAIATGFIELLGILGVSAIFRVHNTANADTLVVDSGSRVGVGTASPATKLQVSASGAATTVRVDPLSGNNNAIVETYGRGTGIAGFRMTAGGAATGWRIDNSGGNLRVVDEVASSAPLIVEATAPTNSLVVDSTGAVACGTASPSSAAVLQADSTSKGFLPPRMTHTQMLAISSPPQGLTVYNTTAKSVWAFNGQFWLPMYPGDFMWRFDDFHHYFTTATVFQAQGWSGTTSGTAGVPTADRAGVAIFTRNNAVSGYVWDSSGTAAGGHQLRTSGVYYARMDMRVTGELANKEFQFGIGQWLSTGLTTTILSIDNGYYFELLGSSNWSTVVLSGASGSPVDAGVAPVLNTWYRLEIVHIPGTSIRFYINGTLVRTATSGMPSDTTDAAFFFRVRRTVSSASTWEVDLAEMIGVPRP